MIQSGNYGRLMEGGRKVKGKWTVASDKKWDKQHSVKQGSKKDQALDKKRGVMPKKGGKKK